jgi:alkylhydroperoxidase/carboxymuconolactone decarboxylase family protein YurZ
MYPQKPTTYTTSMEGALDAKTKVLILVAIAVDLRCEYCP